MERENFEWIDPNIVPEAAHILHHWNTWCVTNTDEKVLVYKKHSLQGNKNKRIAEKFLDMYQELGATKVMLIPHVFLVDSPSRYY